MVNFTFTCANSYVPTAMITKAISNFRIRFNDWKNASAHLASHERGTAHILEMKVTDRIHTSFEQQFLHEEAYWSNVLKRIVAVISFLAERGLPFQDTTEQLGCSNNGNYRGCLELVSKFDPFLAQHLEVYGKCIVPVIKNMQ